MCVNIGGSIYLPLYRCKSVGAGALVQVYLYSNMCAGI